MGLIVNPIAGMGGAVGLKGTDGERAARALALGASPVAADRALKALQALEPCAQAVRWLSCSGSMGADLLASAGFASDTVYATRTEPTRGSDTRAAAAAMLEGGAELILFAGGDGTATDLLEAVGSRVPLLGIPAGVKMHSAVFAVSPRAAADIVCAFVAARDRDAMMDEVEVMDRPEGGEEGAAPHLMGYVRAPVVPLLSGHAKAAGGAGSIEGACRYAVERIREAGLALLGPGATMRRIKQAFGFDGTLLGVDAVRDGRPAALDLAEAEILDLLGDRPALLVVSVVGGQGFLFGRGNQQLSPAVLRRVGLAGIVVVSSMEKLIALPERRLCVDTGDDELDAALAGYLPVIVGFRRTVQVAVGLPAAAEPSARRQESGPSTGAAATDG